MSRATAGSVRSFAAAGVLTLALALGGCSGSGTGGGADKGTGEAAPTATTPSPGTSADTSPAPDTSPTAGTAATPDAPASAVGFVTPDTAAESDAAAGSLLTVTNIRIARHDTFDRVVFDLSGTGTPGWRVEYVDAALDDGSGLPVDVHGDHVLQVRISGTGIPADTGVDEFSGGPLTFDGDGVEQVVYRYTFEGYATAFIGTDDRTPFRVFTLTDPTRVVVDVEHDD